MNFFKRWLAWQLRYLASIVICALLIIAFAASGGMFWPDYAWGTTALFTLVIIWVVSRWK
ncbi:hypothetical protein CPI84_00960 [Erwinia pyrifoliae]|nr:hypothetical protein CPI84_00960 [Erwinia pyrifoliae]MCA8875066.1 hypothetical protein [Erwinia pyrifoliae]